MARPSVVGAAAIEPLRSWPTGRYEDDVVVVKAGGGAGISARLRADGRIAIEHRLSADEVDDELAGPLARALDPHTADYDVFARAFTGVVLTSAPDAPMAWERFYRNTLARLWLRAAPGYSAIYRFALDLLPTTTVLDLGCGFGFLALHLARRGTVVTACDIDAGTIGLVRYMSRRLQLPMSVVMSDGAEVPLASRSVDAVALLHVLEHLPAPESVAVLEEAMRIARSRVVVAVPFETTPTRLFGHVRTLVPEDLHALGALAARSGWEYQVHEHHGGWLVLDRAPSSSRSPIRAIESFEGETQ